MSDALPKKLKADAILEAVLEIRFEPDPSLVSEILFGRFADADAWKSFRQSRLPTADIPAAIRRADPALRYQPSINLASPDGSRIVRIGPQVVAYSSRGQYSGWSKFGAELDDVVSHLYRIIPNVQVSRLGLRYINALRSDLHGVTGVDEIDVSICVADHKLSSSFNVNFRSGAGTEFETMSRIASVDLAEGNIPEHSTIIVDIDVHTTNGFSTVDAEFVKAWIKQAHDKEKENFFKIIGEKTTSRLRSD